MAEGFIPRFTDSPENGTGEKFNIKDVMPVSGFSLSNISD